MNEWSEIVRKYELHKDVITQYSNVNAKCLFVQVYLNVNEYKNTWYADISIFDQIENTIIDIKSQN